MTKKIVKLWNVSVLRNQDDTTINNNKISLSAVLFTTEYRLISVPDFWTMETNQSDSSPKMENSVTIYFTVKNKGALKVLHSDAIEVPFLVPQRTIRSKVL